MGTHQRHGAGIGSDPLAMLAFSIADRGPGSDTEPRPSHRDYVRCVGETFTAVQTGRRHKRYRVELQRIDRLPAGPQQEPAGLGLTLRPLGRKPMPEAVYTLHHRGVQPQSVLLTPVGGTMHAVVEPVS